MGGSGEASGSAPAAAPSTFELQASIVAAARESGHLVLDAGRGQPNWLATVPRAGFFTLGSFAVAEAAATGTHARWGELPPASGIARRLRDHLAGDSSPGAAFLTEAIELGSESSGSIPTRGSTSWSARSWVPATRPPHGCSSTSNGSSSATSSRPAVSTSTRRAASTSSAPRAEPPPWPTSSARCARTTSSGRATPSPWRRRCSRRTSRSRSSRSSGSGSSSCPRRTRASTGSPTSSSNGCSNRPSRSSS